MSTTPQTWSIPLTSVTQDKHAARPGCKFPSAYELMGVDGSVDGGLRPFPGFIPVHEFDFDAWESAVVAAIGGSGYHGEGSEIIDCFVRDFIVGDDGYGYGFVYRVKRYSAPTTCDVFIDYWNSKTGTWNRSVLLADSTFYGTGQRVGRMSVTTWGRFIYVFVEGEEPVLFSLVRSGPPWNTDIKTDTGPGLRPSLTSPNDGSTVYPGGLGSITSIATAGRTGEGQIFLTAFLPSTVGLGLVGGNHQDDVEVHALKPGDYAFAYQLYNSENGRRSAISDIVAARTTDFDPGGGAVPLNAALELTYDSSLYDWCYVYRSVRVQDAGGTYIAAILQLDAIITLADHATNNNPLGDPDQVQVVWFYALEDKELVQTEPFTDRTLFDENMPKGGAALYYENTMLVASINTTSVSSTEENRPDDAIRGLGELRYSALTETSPELFPPSNRINPSIPSNDIIVFQRCGPNVIGFSKDRQYHIRKEGYYLKSLEVHEGFGVINHRAVDSAGSLCYFVNSKGLKSVDSLAQLEDVRSLNKIIQEDWIDSIESVSVAFDPWGSTLWVYNADEGEAVLLWFNTAKVTQLRDLPFQLVCRGVWPERFEWDRNDLTVNDGVNNDTYANPLSERVFFVMNAPVRNGSPATTSWRPRVYCVDYYRERTQEAGEFTDSPRRTLMPISGDSVFTVTAALNSGYKVLVDNATRTLSTDIWGSYLYILSSSNIFKIGLRAQIFQRNLASANVIELVSPGAGWSSLAAGDVVGISPVFFRYISPPLPLSMDLASAEPDYFQVRHVDSIGTSFTDVVNERDYQTVVSGCIFTGSSDTPAAVSFSRDVSGALYSALEEGEAVNHIAIKDETGTVFTGKFGADSTILATSVQSYTPDTDFRLVGIMVSGSIRDSVRTRRPTI